MSNTRFADFLKECTTDFTPVLDIKFKQKDYAHIDLSEVSEELKNIEIPSSGEIKKGIDSFLSKKKAKVAYGGYNEKRNFYERSFIFNDDKT